MRIRRFRARRHWQNTVAWIMLCIFMLITVLMYVAVTSAFGVLWIMLVLSAAGTLAAVVRDRMKRCFYVLDGHVLQLRAGNRSLEIDIRDVQDASLIDRAAARDYIQQKLRIAAEKGTPKGRLRERERLFIRYCSVDIGLRSISFGLGRRMIDRMPDARHDLVLLRSRDGRDHLLSPLYNQDLVTSITKAMHERQHV